MNRNLENFRTCYSPFSRGWGLFSLFSFFITFFLNSCDDSALFDSGKTVTKEIALTENFTTIEVKELFDIKLVNDTENKAILTCGENLLPGIKIYVENESLYLDQDLKYKWSRNYDKIKLELHLISASYINVHKPCHIFTTDTFKSSNFILVDWGKFTDLDVLLDVAYTSIQVSSDNYGIYRLHGKTQDADFVGRGSIFVYAGDMEIRNCNVDTKSIGDFYLEVSKSLNATITSSGNIYYKGNPVIVNDLKSTGKVIRWNN